MSDETPLNAGSLTGCDDSAGLLTDENLKKLLNNLRSDILSGQRCSETEVYKSKSSSDDRKSKLFKLLQGHKNLILKQQAAIDELLVENG